MKHKSKVSSEVINQESGLNQVMEGPHIEVAWANKDYNLYLLGLKLEQQSLLSRA
jgi:hypothetical protein